jgi:hypothetical protein
MTTAEQNRRKCITTCGHYSDIIIANRKSHYGRGKYQKRQISRELMCRRCAEQLNDRLITDNDCEKYLKGL